MNIEYNKKEMWYLFKREFLDSKFNLKELCIILNINMGTVKRWITNKEVPPNYFNDFNRILNNKYKINLTTEERYKVMDQFFTSEKEANRLVNYFIEYVSKNWNIKLDDYTFIEPSAGNGAFSNSIPKKFKKVVLDIEPQDKKITKKDWFDYEPENNSKNIIIGNPPFGLRGQLALKFINHGAEFADFIAFILPPLFNSNGKGSPKLRINKKFNLVKELKLNNNNFTYPSGKIIEVNSIFQIWTKLKSSKVKPIEIPKKDSELMKIYSMSNGNTPSSKRNVKMIGKVDFYLPSTTFEEVKLYSKFSDLPHKRGYGILIKKDKKKIKNIINNIDWKKISFKSTNAANNLRMELIIQAIEKKHMEV